MPSATRLGASPSRRRPRCRSRRRRRPRAGRGPAPRPCCRRCRGRSRRRRMPCRPTSAAAAMRGSRTSRPERLLDAGRAARRRRRATSSRCPEASPRSVVGSAPRPPSCQVSESWGSITSRIRPTRSGSWSRIQRSLVIVYDALNTLPVSSAQRSAPPSSSTRSAAAPALRTSFHSSASWTGSPCSSSATMPCCWPPTATASARSSRRPVASSSALQPGAAGRPAVPAGCGGAALVDDACRRPRPTSTPWSTGSRSRCRGRGVSRPCP